MPSPEVTKIHSRKSAGRTSSFAGVNLGPAALAPDSWAFADVAAHTATIKSAPAAASRCFIFMQRTLAWPEPCEGDGRRFQMVLTAASLSPVLAILFGILIFVFPKLLNYLVAIYLILSGLIGLGVLSLR